MDPRNQDEPPAPSRRLSDEEIAAEAAALGQAQISRSTGTGGPGSGPGPAPKPSVTHPGPDAPPTSPVTAPEDIGEAVDIPSLAGGTGQAGSGLGSPSVPVPPPPGTETFAPSERDRRGEG